MDYMDHTLNVGAGSAAVSRVASADFEDKFARDWLVASLEKVNDDASQIDWAAEPRYSRVVAEALETQIKSSTITSQNTRHSLSALIYVPIMIRVFAGGEALKGERFDWKTDDVGNYHAVSSDKTDWEISGSGSSWEITVARWDRPEYASSNLERAKRIAEQLDAA
jgi:hypothetical protein